MAARSRRRRRPATRRRVRRWLRRQDRLTRTLLVAVAALGALVVALMLSLPEPTERAARSRPAPARPTRVTGAREGARAPVTPAARTRRRVAVRPPASATAPAPPPRAAGQAGAGRAAAPRLAIVIDDLGQNLAHLEKLAGLGVPLSIAVIPGLPATARTVREAARRDIEILLHQPMEPREEGGKNPGDGVLLTSMTPEAVRQRLRDSLAAVPGAVGVNNHMGSRFTEDAPGVGALMAELRDQGLFWLDSRTTPATAGPAAARALGVPAIERDIFIDAEVDADFIRGQLHRLVEIARQRGAAVGIGHPHAETLAVLREMRDELLASGVTLVPVSALVPAAPPGPLRPAAGAPDGRPRAARHEAGAHAAATP